jgi:hypothetical protein
MESDMSPLKTSCSVIAAISILAMSFSAEAAVQIKHRHVSRGVVGPAIEPYPPISSGDYGASYGAGAVGGGVGFSRDSGGVNSMSNDFGTSGVLGHTNGQPVWNH